MSRFTELIRKHRRNGWTLKRLSEHFGVTISAVRHATADIPATDRAVLKMIAAKIRENPELTDKEISLTLGVSVEHIASQRKSLDKHRHILIKMCGEQLDDRQDYGRRIKPQWIKQHCSRGQRNLRQIQAIIGSENITFREVIESVKASGLPIHPTNGIVGTPRKEPEHNPLNYEKRYRIGSVGRSLKRTH